MYRGAVSSSAGWTDQHEARSDALGRPDRLAPRAAVLHGAPRPVAGLLYLRRPFDAPDESVGQHLGEAKLPSRR